MRAAVLTEPGRPLEIQEVEIADPQPREVLIRTVACGLCHSDLNFIDGKYPHPLPAIPGHEAAGIVEAVGSEVRSVKVGDAVVTCLSAHCGHCEFCVTGQLALCLGGGTRRSKDSPPRMTYPNGDPVLQMLNLSSFAEKMLIDESACVAINPDMPLDKASVLGCAVITGSSAVFQACNVTPGESVAVIGCGGVGLAAINAAKIAGAAQIIAADPLPEKRKLAEEVGATHSVDASADDAAKQIIEISGGGVHHAIEAVGVVAAGQLAVKSLRRGGTATVLGMMPLDKGITMSATDLLSDKKLQGALMGQNRFPVDIPRLVDFYMRGVLDLDNIVAETIPLDDINKGLDKLRKGNAARSVIVFDQ